MIRNDLSLPTEERAKYHAVLQLSRQQADALETGDMAAFQAILTLKGKLIGALRQAGSLAYADPEFATLVEQIRASERSAELLLRRKMSQTGQELRDLSERKTARRAYQSSTHLNRSLAPASVSADTPRLFDLQT